MQLFHLRRLAFCLVATLFLTGEAFACSITIFVRPFEPDVHAVNRNADLGHEPGPPPVNVQVGEIRRPNALVECDLYTEVDLVLSWAEPTTLRWGDVGFYMHQVVAEGGVPRTGFFPEKAELVDGKPQLTLRVLDHSPSSALDFDVDIFAIDHGLRLGPTRRFHVHAVAEPAEANLRHSHGPEASAPSH